MLGETVRLLASHLHLFTLIALTVWLPGHVARHYIEFFEEGIGGAEQTLRVLRLSLTIHVVFEPLVVAATVYALSRIVQGQDVGYRAAMLAGFSAWARLFPVRFVMYFVFLLPLPAAAALPSLGATAGGLVMLAAAAAISAAGILTIVLAVRFAVVDSVVVLEGATVATAWRRAAELTRGRRGAIFRTLAVLVIVRVAVQVAGLLLGRVPEANHFVARVLFDCAIAVGQTLFTIALFLYYWRARMGAVAPAP